MPKGIWSIDDLTPIQRLSQPSQLLPRSSRASPLADKAGITLNIYDSGGARVKKLHKVPDSTTFDETLYVSNLYETRTSLDATDPSEVRPSYRKALLTEVQHVFLDGRRTITFVDGEPYFYLPDHLGSTSLMTN